MSTIVVAQKNGKACIGADTLSSLGSLRQKALHVVNKTKIAKIEDTFIGLTGTSASLVVMRSYFANAERPRDFSSTEAIFETFRHAHFILKNEYFMAATPDKDDEFETTQFYGLAANASGIYAIYSFRSAQQFHRFWAAGSGRDYALGAMQAVYDQYGTAEEIARAGLAAAAEFDSATGAPFEIHTVPLAVPPAKSKKASVKKTLRQRK
ncbi:MAG: transporter [Verrucomicrobiaceae bacterium]|nr:transporter [Verrucomicrobiaceae bacterium]